MIRYRWLVWDRNLYMLCWQAGNDRAQGGCPLGLRCLASARDGPAQQCDSLPEIGQFMASAGRGWSAVQCLTALAITAGPIGADGDAARLHLLWQFAHQVDVKQAVLVSRAFLPHVIGELEATLKAACGDAPVQIAAVLLLRALAAHGQLVLFGLDVQVVATETRHRERN